MRTYYIAPSHSAGGSADPLHRPLKPYLWAYLATQTLTLLLWAASGSQQTRNPTLYSALVSAAFAAYVVDTTANYVAALDYSRGQSAELGAQNILLLAWPILPLLIEAGGSLAEFVT